MNDIAADDSPRCTTCHRSLHADVWGRQACRPCQDRTDENLRVIAGPDGLYAKLGGALMPGAGNGGPAVSGSRTAPLPVRLEPLSLSARGGVVTVLQTWLIDWHEQLGWTHPRWAGNLRQQCDQVVRQLRVNLDWAAASHPAFDEFAREVATLRRQCEAAITGDRGERPIKVACPCGATLRITVSTSGVRCYGCEQQYDRDAAFDLPLAERSAA